MVINHFLPPNFNEEGNKDSFLLLYLMMMYSILFFFYPSRMCINGQLSHQQLGLDNLQDVLSGHLSVDPSLVSDVSIYQVLHF